MSQPLAHVQPALAAVPAVPPAPPPAAAGRLSSLLRAGTVAADVLAVCGALVFLGIGESPLAPVLVPACAVAWLVVLSAIDAYGRRLSFAVGAEARAVAFAALVGSV